MRSVITGSGIGIPDNVVTNDDLARIMETSDEWIRTRSGIEQRRFASSGQGSSELGATAAKAAIENAGLEPDAIDAVVFATMTPDYYFPGNGPLLQERIGLRQIPTFDIRQQCSGFLYGLDLVDSLIRSGKYGRVLLVGSEVHTPFMPWDKGWKTLIGEESREVTDDEREYNTRYRDRVVLFGDGAGAVVVEGRDENGRGLLETRLFTDGSLLEALWVQGGSFLKRPWLTKEQVDDGSYVPDMAGREVFRQAVRKMPESILAVCEAAGIDPSEIDLVLAHQANLRIIEGVRKALDFPEEKVPHNIERYGNTTAGTLPILYHELVSEGRIREGMLLAFTALGSGLHWGAALYRV